MQNDIFNCDGLLALCFFIGAHTYKNKGECFILEHRISLGGREYTADVR